jgi:hypothetical protein
MAPQKLQKVIRSANSSVASTDNHNITLLGEVWSRSQLVQRMRLQSPERSSGVVDW